MNYLSVKQKLLCFELCLAGVSRGCVDTMSLVFLSVCARALWVFKMSGRSILRDA